ncbi:hypothetical protein BB2000_1431 [Proteus mirabilis BB2000]|nr:hypothetical protein BB2000_1431 [Proteus mirabilis BB2000]
MEINLYNTKHNFVERFQRIDLQASLENRTNES